MPKVEIITIVLKTGNAPIKIIASLTNPLNPGKPKPAKKAIATKAYAARRQQQLQQHQRDNNNNNNGNNKATTAPKTQTVKNQNQ